MQLRTSLFLFALPALAVLCLPGSASAADGSAAPAGFSLAAFVEVLARPGSARVGLALLGAIGVFRWRGRRRRGSVL